jgi:hypothetical protein
VQRRPVTAPGRDQAGRVPVVPGQLPPVRSSAVPPFRVRGSPPTSRSSICSDPRPALSHDSPPPRPRAPSGPPRERVPDGPQCERMPNGSPREPVPSDPPPRSPRKLVPGGCGCERVVAPTARPLPVPRTPGAAPPRPAVRGDSGAVLPRARRSSAGLPSGVLVNAVLVRAGRGRAALAALPVPAGPSVSAVPPVPPCLPRRAAVAVRRRGTGSRTSGPPRRPVPPVVGAGWTPASAPRARVLAFRSSVSPPCRCSPGRSAAVVRRPVVRVTDRPAGPTCGPHLPRRAGLHTGARSGRADTYVVLLLRGFTRTE